MDMAFQHQQMSNTDENLADKGIGYGMESYCRWK
jgi:hypothetical protein